MWQLVQNSPWLLLQTRLARDWARLLPGLLDLWRFGHEQLQLPPRQGRWIVRGPMLIDKAVWRWVRMRVHLRELTCLPPSWHSGQKGEGRIRKSHTV